MKLIVITAAIASLIGLGFVFKNNSTQNKSSGSSFDSVTVLELFTSEGCSSCPSADNLLPELANLDPNIIALSFHVDYWNRLGWTDPFSNAEFSARQQQYAKQFHLEAIYTPQLVVNGEYQLIGSDRLKATQTITNTLKEKPIVYIRIGEVKKETDKLLVSCQIQGDLKKVNLLAAVVQKQVSVNVKAGENNGAKLSHTNVVRAFAKQTAASQTTFTLKIPADVANDNWQLIIYAQRQNDLKIIGAAAYKE